MRVLATLVRGVSRDQLHANTPAPELALTEEARYRFDQTRVGYALARGWQLPETLCRTILPHHEIGQVTSRTRAAAAANPALLAVGLLAEQVVRLRAGQPVTGDWSAHEGFA